MIISRTPFRISFCGGGTDLRSYYHYEGGAVVSSTIDKYIYITVNRLTRYFEHSLSLKYSQTELVNSVEEVRHPIIREALKLTGVTERVEIASMADIPSGTGLGSSSAYAVSLLHALYTFKGESVSARKLAEQACDIEIEILKDPIGKQDQFIAAYGGICHIVFNPDESVFIDPIVCSPATKKTLQDNLLIFYTGMTRRAGDILEVQKAQTSKKMEVLNGMKGLCFDLIQVLRSSRSLSAFGEILHQGWLLKKSLVQEISNNSIDAYYDRARTAGAIGGKLLGAGGGGFLLFYVEPQNQSKVRSALADLNELRFQFEPQGSKVIYISD